MRVRNKFSIIAETAFSHEGSFDYLIKQIDTAAKGKADFIKFQVFLDKNDYFLTDHPAFQTAETWMLSQEEWQQAFAYAKRLKLKIIALPLNLASLDFCLSLQAEIDGLEIHSVCFNEIPFLKKMSLFNKLIILGVGGRNYDEIELAIDYLSGKGKEIVLMHGFQSFPTSKYNLNLAKIKKAGEAFPYTTQGFADHTSWDSDDFYDVNNYAMTLGAQFFEKHIVLEKGKDRIDYNSAISFEDFLQMREKLEDLNRILGNDDLANLNSGEQKYRERGKGIFANNEILANTEITEDLISYKVSEEIYPFPQSIYGSLLGKKAKYTIKKNQLINPMDFI